MSKYQSIINKYKSNKLSEDKIRSWITKHFPDFKARKDGKELLICNPFTDDTGYNFNINPDGGVCHCWTGNEWAGPINPETNKRNCSFINFVKLYKKCSYQYAISDVLGASVNIGFYLKPENRIIDKQAQRKIAVALPDGVEPLTISKDSQVPSLIRWLGSRGYSEDDIKKYDLHHLGMDVYWPYYEFDTLVYWQSRSRLNKRFNFPSIDIYDKNGKIIGQTDGTKGDFFYGFDDVEFANYIIITEAIFDKHTLGEQALASGGAILTPKQIGKLKILGPKKGIILSPDNDNAGIKSIVTNSQLLQSHGFDVYYSLPPNKIENIIVKDWNELLTKCKLTKEQIRKIHDNNIKPVDIEELINLCLEL